MPTPSNLGKVTRVEPQRRRTDQQPEHNYDGARWLLLAIAVSGAVILAVLKAWMSGAL